MAQPQILEGTWEEVKQRHDQELSGHHVQVIVLPDKEKTALYELHERESMPEQPGAAKDDFQAITGGGKKRQLQGRGVFKGKLGGTEALIQEKRKDVQREERRF